MTLAIKAWHDYHGTPVLFGVADEDGHELARFPSEREALERKATIEDQRRLVQEVAAAATRQEAEDIIRTYCLRHGIDPGQLPAVLAAELTDLLAEKPQ
jgi:hypothetical protein